MLKTALRSTISQGARHWTWEVAAQDLPYQIGSLYRVMLLSGDRWANILAEVLYIVSERGIDMNEAMQAMVVSDQKKVDSRTQNEQVPVFTRLFMIRLAGGYGAGAV